MTDSSLTLLQDLEAAFGLDIDNHFSEHRGVAHLGQAKAIQFQKLAFQKKFIPTDDVGGEQRKRDAWDLFLKMNEHAKYVNDNFQSRIERDDIHTVMLYAKESLYWLHDNPPNIADICRGLNPGPGSVAAPQGSQIDTSWYSKFFENTRTSSNPGVHRMVTQILLSHPIWADAERHRILACELYGRPSYYRDQPGYFFTVRKNALVDRGCVSEPTDNQLCQKGTGEYMVDLLLSGTGIPLKDQQFINQRLASVGSIGGKRGWHFCTMDGRSASDTICSEAIKFNFGYQWHSWLHSIRSKTVMSEFTETPVELHMVSTMGNGFTFPMQTIFFQSLIVGTYRFLGLPLYDTALISLTGSPRTYGIFGDDIIVDERAYDLLAEVLSACGFLLNSAKSYRGNDRFRESCGADFYDGYNVRPVHIESLTTIQDRLSSLNRLMEWGFKHSVSLPNVAELLFKSVPQRFRYPIPGSESVDSGIVLPLSLVSSKKLPGTVLCNAFSPVKTTTKALYYEASVVDRLYGINTLSDRYLAWKNELETSHALNDVSSGVACHPMYAGYVYKRFLAKAVTVQKIKKVCRVYGWEELVLSNDKMLAILSSALSIDGRVSIRVEKTQFESKMSYTPGWNVLQPTFSLDYFETKKFGMKPWTLDESLHSSKVALSFEHYLEKAYGFLDS